MKAVVAAFNQEKALVGAFSVITNIRMELFQALEQEVELVKSVQILTCMLDVLIVQFNVQVPHYLLLRR